MKLLKLEFNIFDPRATKINQTATQFNPPESLSSNLEPHHASFENNNQITDLKLIYDKEIVDNWSNKKWPNDMLSEVMWLVKEQAKTKNILKKGNLILTGAYGFPIPINNKKIIEVTSSAFGDVKAIFN